MWNAALPQQRTQTTVAVGMKQQQILFVPPCGIVFWLFFFFIFVISLPLTWHGNANWLEKWAGALSQTHADKAASKKSCVELNGRSTEAVWFKLTKMCKSVVRDLESWILYKANSTNGGWCEWVNNVFIMKLKSLYKKITVISQALYEILCILNLASVINKVTKQTKNKSCVILI